jgi:arginase
MTNRLAIIGVPSSAGAYAPGQEKTPAALRAVGLIELLTMHGIPVDDHGDVSGFRWSADKENPRAMNSRKVATVVRATAERIASVFVPDTAVLVLGGDCTVELGTVSGMLRGTSSIGVVYIDLDTDLNTPESTIDGALDWMGVAHMLGVAGTVPEIAGLGPRAPMLQPEQVLFFASDNIEPFERQLIDDLDIAEVRLADVVANPARAAEAVVDGWARQFERLLIHLDVDVLEYFSMPLAENTRRTAGLRFDQLMTVLRTFLRAPNWAALTICELNPDHGEIDGSTLHTFAEGLADALAASPRWKST